MYYVLNKFSKHLLDSSRYSLTEKTPLHRNDSLWWTWVSIHRWSGIWGLLSPVPLKKTQRCTTENILYMLNVYYQTKHTNIYEITLNKINISADKLTWQKNVVLWTMCYKNTFNWPYRTIQVSYILNRQSNFRLCFNIIRSFCNSLATQLNSVNFVEEYLMIDSNIKAEIQWTVWLSIKLVWLYFCIFVHCIWKSY